MKSHYAPKLAALLRSAARYGSVAAALVFGFALLADRNTAYHLGRLVSGADAYPDLRVFFSMIAGALLGGFLAWDRRFAPSGVALTAASLTAAFAWCGSTLEYSLSPFMVALVVPSGMMVLAKQLEQLPVEAEAVAVEEAPEAEAPEQAPVLVPAASVA